MMVAERREEKGRRGRRGDTGGRKAQRDTSMVTLISSNMGKLNMRSV